MARLWGCPRRRALHAAHPDHRDECRSFATGLGDRTGDFSPGSPGHRATTFEATPILAHGTLYFCTPYNRVIALQAETGKPLWAHEPDPKLDRAYNQQHSLICRGVSYWEAAQPNPAMPCQSRIYQGVLDGRLEALDARTGQLCADFAGSGTIDLNKLDNGGVGPVNVTSAPVVFEDLVIVGSAIGDNHRTNEPSGFVRAFDVRTGQERWHWSPIPAALRGQVGAGNVWAPMAVDTERGILYAPTTSPSPDYYGGLRTDPLPGVDAIVALRPDRRVDLAGPDGASRPVGLRPAGAADAGGRAP